MKKMTKQIRELELTSNLYDIKGRSVTWFGELTLNFNDMYFAEVYMWGKK